MVFSSSTFLLVFLPLTLALYFAVPGRAAKNVVLLVVSLVFYAWGEPVYILLMAASIVLNWALALVVERCPAGPRRKALLAAGLAADLAILGFFKYEGFLTGNINALAGAQVIPDLELPLPIGISFYTLQAVSYVADVYRGEVKAQRNPLYLGMYIAMFPQLIAGPIVRYSTIQDQVLHRRESLAGFAAGMRLFCVGLAKKVLLANTAAILATGMLEVGGASVGAVGAWAGLAAYTFQILFDFSGYSDMAIGLGRMFGFEYLRNFNYPYISRSVTEFWRRWHISLSSFFRDYVYIPLGGSRCSRPRHILNLAVVWVLTGFWHGAAWNFVLWGVYYLMLLLLEKFVWGKALRRLPTALRHLYCIAAFMLGWLIFWVEDMGTLAEYLAAMLGAFGATGSQTFWQVGAWAYAPVLIACAVASTPVVPWLRAKLMAWAKGERLQDFMAADLPAEKHLGTDQLCDYGCYLAETRGAPVGRRVAVCAAFLLADAALLACAVLSVLSVVSGSFNPFIYFRF